MTITVNAYCIKADGSELAIPLTSDLAGVEQSRSSFYGSLWAQQLGLALLPKLNEVAELQVSGSELAVLLNELTILQHAVLGREDESYWSFRLSNIISAVQQASSCDGVGYVRIG